MDYDVLAEIREALASQDTPALSRRLHEMRAADLADVVERLEPGERDAVFLLLDDDAAGAVLHNLDEGAAAAIVRALPPERASRILGEMPHDDAADVLQDLPEADADALLAGMGAEDAESVRVLLEYPENTAGGRMVTDFVTVSEQSRVSQVIDGLRVHPPNPETAYYLYVQDSRGRLAGVVSLRDLVVAAPEARVGEIMTRDVIRVPADTDQEEAADLVARYDLLVLPVVDAEDRMVGVITVDDVLEVLEEEATEDILHLSSAAEAHPERTTPSIAARLPRVGTAIAAGVVAAALIAALFLSAKAPLPLLLFVPLLLAMSEVVTGQVMAAVVSATRREASSAELARAAGRELLMMAVLAVVASVLLYLLLGHWEPNGTLRTRMAVAVFVATMTSAAVAVILPASAHALRRDASALSVSLTAALSDIAALVAYLALVARA